MQLPEMLDDSKTEILDQAFGRGFGESRGTNCSTFNVAGLVNRQCLVAPWPTISC